MMYALTSSQMKALDKRTIEHYGVASLVLMERAALAVSEEAGRLLPDRDGKVLVVAGTGNNGADALAVARLLYLAGHKADALIVGEKKSMSEECLAQLKSVRAYGIPCVQFRTGTHTADALSEEGYDLIIDGLFGIGCTRELKGVYAAAVDMMNGLHFGGISTVPLLAIDMPSGINADNGAVMGCAVYADTTVSFQFAKAGHLLFPGAGHTGHLIVRDVGISMETTVVTRSEASFGYECLPPHMLLNGRRADTHKGDYGRLLIIAGSHTTGGCAALAAKAALRTGCGMVRVLTHKNNYAPLLSTVPEAMADIYDDGTEGDELRELLHTAFKWADAVVAGPGIGTDSRARTIVETILRDCTCHCLLDADALRLIAGDSELSRLAGGYSGDDKALVLTPHAAEFAALFGESTEVCLSHMHDYPKILADRLSAVVLMKSARSVTASPDDTFSFINTSGNNGMATAGSGDVLSGIIGALLSSEKESYRAFRAAFLGAYLHGYAGDAAAARLGRYSMTAMDIAEALPAVTSGRDVS